MATAFLVEIVTPERTVFSGSAERLSVPGTEGSLGILGGHAPLLTSLKIGEATMTEAGGKVRRFYIGGGFLEVKKNKVTILADEAAADTEIDAAEAERQLQAAGEKLSAAGEGPEAVAAKIAYDRAAARQKVAGKL